MLTHVRVSTWMIMMLTRVKVRVGPNQGDESPSLVLDN